MMVSLNLGVLRASAIAALSLLAAGCSSLHRGSSFRAVSSQPPVRAIELTAPAAVSEEGAITTFPPGKYRPQYEDEGGYYFEAPRKVLVDDVATYAFDGGVYVRRGQTAPTRWYVIRPNGRRTMGGFKTPPVYKLL
jgi:hypothetical protein